MASFVQPLFGDALVNGMAFLSLGFVSYLFWLRFREKRNERKSYASGSATDGSTGDTCSRLTRDFRQINEGVCVCGGDAGCQRSG